jgi:P pilus assembly chaperone PapD
MMRINAMPDAAMLPQDREHFYFNVREVPPKSERPNVMQLALHTKIKLFYRPKPFCRRSIAAGITNWCCIK